MEIRTMSQKIPEWFTGLMMKLNTAFPTDLTALKVQTYWEVLGGIEQERLYRGVSNIIDSRVEKYFPTPAEIKNFIPSPKLPALPFYDAKLTSEEEEFTSFFLKYLALHAFERDKYPLTVNGFLNWTEKNNNINPKHQKYVDAKASRILDNIEKGIVL
jgi:hypothetical protein